MAASRFPSVLAAVICALSFAAVSSLVFVILWGEGRDFEASNAIALVVIALTALAFGATAMLEHCRWNARASVVLWLVLAASTVYLISFSFILVPALLLGVLSIGLRGREPPDAEPGNSHDGTQSDGTGVATTPGDG